MRARKISTAIALSGALFLLSHCGSKNQTALNEAGSNRINDAYYVAPIDRLRDVAIPVVVVRTTNRETTTHTIHSMRFHGSNSDTFSFGGQGGQNPYVGGPLSTGEYGVAAGGVTTRIYGNLTRITGESVNMEVRGEFRGTDLPELRTYTMTARTQEATLNVLRALYPARPGRVFAARQEQDCQAAFSMSCAQVFGQ